MFVLNDSEKESIEKLFKVDLPHVLEFKKLLEKEITKNLERCTSLHNKEEIFATVKYVAGIKDVLETIKNI